MAAPTSWAKARGVLETAVEVSGEGEQDRSPVAPPDALILRRSEKWSSAAVVVWRCLPG